VRAMGRPVFFTSFAKMALTAEGPDELWVGDITYDPTHAGFLFLSVVMDAWSRRIIGWSMAPHLRTELVLDALEMTLGQRRPDNVVHHTNCGSQYTSLAFGKCCREAGVRPSMGTVGDAHDNAMCESFFATLECELLGRKKFHSHSESEMEIFTLISPPSSKVGTTPLAAQLLTISRRSTMKEGIWQRPEREELDRPRNRGNSSL
jgi:transposase InsO family protein